MVLEERGQRGTVPVPVAVGHVRGEGRDRQPGEEVQLDLTPVAHELDQAVEAAESAGQAVALLGVVADDELEPLGRPLRRGRFQHRRRVTGVEVDQQRVHPRGEVRQAADVRLDGRLRPVEARQQRTHRVLDQHALEEEHPGLPGAVLGEPLPAVEQHPGVHVVRDRAVIAVELAEPVPQPVGPARAVAVPDQPEVVDPLRRCGEVVGLVREVAAQPLELLAGQDGDLLEVHRMVGPPLGEVVHRDVAVGQPPVDEPRRRGLARPRQPLDHDQLCHAHRLTSTALPRSR